MIGSWIDTLKPRNASEMHEYDNQKNIVVESIMSLFRSNRNGIADSNLDTGRTVVMKNSIVKSPAKERGITSHHNSILINP